MDDRPRMDRTASAGALDGRASPSTSEAEDETPCEPVGVPEVPASAATSVDESVGSKAEAKQDSGQPAIQPTPSSTLPPLPVLPSPTGSTISNASDSSSASQSPSPTPSSNEHFPTTEEFEILMESTYGLKLLEAFMKSEFNDEVLRFYLAGRAFQKVEDPQEQLSMAQSLMHQFIDPDGLTPITVLSRTITELTKKVQAQDVDNTFFDALIRSVFYDLRREVFPRFFRHQLYHKWRRHLRREELRRLTALGRPPPELDGSSADLLAIDEDSDVEAASPLAGSRQSGGPVSPKLRVFRQGWMLKRGEVFKTWRTRFFILKMGLLQYYIKKNDAKPKKSLVVTGATATAVDDKKYGRSNVFEVVVPKTNRIYLLAASSPEERAEWIQAFTDQVLEMRKHRSAARAKEHMVICHLTTAEKKRSPLGGKPYIAYKIRVQTGTLVWSVWKRFSEFEALHKAIRVKYRHELATHEVPQFPQKESFSVSSVISAVSGTSDRDLVEQRIRSFNHYLKALVAVPEICNGPELLQFLGLLTTHIGEKHTVIDMDSVPGAVDIGDVLLMRTPSGLASVQRTFTRSRWDHVGIVVSIPMLSQKKHNLAVLEAVGNGVVCFPLEGRLMDARNSHQVVAIRKLTWTKTEDRLRQLELFVDKAKGKKYSLRGLFVDSGDKYFFCSQLVQACYRAMGIMSQDVANSRLLPGDFSSQSSKLELVNACLEGEMFVNFDRQGLARARNTEDMADSLMAAAMRANEAARQTMGETKRESRRRSQTMDTTALSQAERADLEIVDPVDGVAEEPELEAASDTELIAQPLRDRRTSSGARDDDSLDVVASTRPRRGFAPGPGSARRRRHKRRERSITTPSDLGGSKKLMAMLGVDAATSQATSQALHLQMGARERMQQKQKSLSSLSHVSVSASSSRSNSRAGSRAGSTNKLLALLGPEFKDVESPKLVRLRTAPASGSRGSRSKLAKVLGDEV